uniref:Uncharacterized protein n=1 Tax=Fagus sylvatica TaxID=28930 RepID=A0A2N9G0Z0_FAGSY
MATTCSVLPQESFDEEYHGGAPASIPFTWESQPGTPKAKFHQTTTTLPPLTPPPSYDSTTAPLIRPPPSFDSTTATTRHVRKNSRRNLLYTIFPIRNGKNKTRLSPSPTSSSSSSSSSSSFISSPLSRSYSVSPSHQRGRSSSLSSDSTMDEEENKYEFPGSTLYFVNNRGVSSRFRGCYASIIKLFLRD